MSALPQSETQPWNRLAFAGRNVHLANVKARYEGGWTVADIAEDYEVSEDEVRRALRTAEHYLVVLERQPCRGAACPVRTSNASGFCGWCRGRIEELEEGK